MSPDTIRTSSGMSLANALYEALDDFWLAFNRPPSLILIPDFRMAEIEFLNVTFYIDGVPTFAGVRFQLHPGQAIEIS